MATIDVKDASGTSVAIEKPLAPGQAASAASRPVVLSTENMAALASQTTLAALLAKVIAAPSTEAKQDDTNVLLNAIGLSVDGVEAALGALATQTTLAAVLTALGSPMQNSGGSLAPIVLGTSADLAFNATSAQSAALVGTRIRVVASGADCRIAIGSNPTATATGTLLKDGIPEYFTITSGHKVAAIRNASTDGTLNITVAG